MNRLDRMIARLTAQRACLAHAAALIAELPGPALEIGFGKGRTYSFLREILPAREIYAFDIDGAPDTDWGPDAAHFFAGDFRETFPKVLERTGAPAALVHCDIGSEDAARDAALVAWMHAALPPLLCAGAIVVADRDLDLNGAERLEMPSNALDWPYFVFRHQG
ncbi:MAG TPA: class I SAM-dependent methyltransferase [Alphaproteobacteria bacterium]|nr:class I SAM-dependent methyltransferase [Alphaproteobacteria bacterium]